MHLSKLAVPLPCHVKFRGQRLRGPTYIGPAFRERGVLALGPRAPPPPPPRLHDPSSTEVPLWVKQLQMISTMEYNLRLTIQCGGTAGPKGDA